MVNCVRKQDTIEKEQNGHYGHCCGGFSAKYFMTYLFHNRKKLKSSKETLKRKKKKLKRMQCTKKRIANKTCSDEVLTDSCTVTARN